MGELPGWNLRRIDLPDHDASRLLVRRQIDVERPRARLDGREALVERVDQHLLAAARGGRRPLRGQRRFSRARRAEQQRAGAAIEPAAEHRVQLPHAAGGNAALEVLAVLGRDQTREDHDPAALDDEVVVAAAEVDAAQLRDPQAAALRPVEGDQLLHRHHPVREALQVSVGLRAGEVVEQQHGAAPAREVLLERQHLAAIAQRALGEQANLRQRIEHEPRRFHARAQIDHRLGRLRELDLGGMEQRVLLVAAQRIGGRQLEQLDALERPAVRRRDHLQLFPGLRQRDVDAALAPSRALEQELQGEGGLADARIPSMSTRRPAGKPPRRMSSMPDTPVLAHGGLP